MKKVNLVIVIAIIVVALVSVSFKLGGITGNLLYTPNYNVPVVIDGSESVFTWYEKTAEASCKEYEEDEGFNIYKKGYASYRPKYHVFKNSQDDHCKDAKVLIEFVCSENMPKEASSYSPSEFMLRIFPEEVYGFEVECPIMCRRGACM